MSNGKIILTCGLLGVTSALGWHLMTRVPAAHVALSLDPSASVERKCGDLPGATRNFLGATPGVKAGSTLTMLVMGTDTRNAQPKLAFSAAVPIPPDTVYGKDNEAHAKAEEEFFGKIEQHCTSAKAGSGSPIYELVKQGLAHLQSSPSLCGPKRPCASLIKTDLDEDVNPSIRSVLDRAVKDPGVSVPAELARSLNNAGVDVTFCGVAEVLPRRKPGASLDARQQIWTAMFTNPELVHFQPYCQ